MFGDFLLLITFYFPVDIPKYLNPFYVGSTKDKVENMG